MYSSKVVPFDIETTGKDLEKFQTLGDKEESLYKFLQNTLELNILTVSTTGVGGLSIFALSHLSWEREDALNLALKGDEYYNPTSILVMWIMCLVENSQYRF